MAGLEGWMYQGRQYHQWFGHGTKPKDGSPGGSGLEGLDQRIRSLASTAIAGLKPSQRSHRAASFDGPSTDRLVVATHAWIANLERDKDTFAEAILGLSVTHPAVPHLREAAERVASANSYADMRAASDALAAGMSAIGLDN